ncbi:KTSC domain-containing protein [Dyadobacter sp. CY326]|uniref:KTSC domain-containing protein n=1 Tax=Dyadobacter sp. CY326 TaxID=2907300 RepID=UPI001F33E1B0|nr:KTSC domain-containing protein [Dyadobacter sp. CY326]MCE7064806.1 KTSC domain-containing protein [Dyadobacter sp. CY326]
MPSSVVAEMIYNEHTETLRIVFVSGMVYDYQKVPLHIFQALRNASSKGTYLNQEIKNNYEFVKVGE